MNFETILFEVNNEIGFALITLNRPDKLNALNKQLFDDLNNAIAIIETNDNIKAVILTGSGAKAFAAGADIVELNQCDKNTGRVFSEYGSKVMLRLEQLRKPVIAAVNGFALGGGCELAMSCHIRYASENAIFGQPEVDLGIIPGYGGTQRLTRLIGLSRSMELNLTGKKINAQTAFAYGLVSEVFPQEELLNKAIELATLICSKAKLAVNAVVDTVLISQQLSPMEGLAYESIKFGQVCGTNDFKEGTTAFLEKRKAEFKGN